MNIKEINIWLKLHKYSKYVKPSHRIKLSVCRTVGNKVGDYDFTTQEIRIFDNVLYPILFKSSIDKCISQVLSHEFIHYLIHREVGLMETIAFDNVAGNVDNAKNLGDGL